jgi:2-keto-3-deoxy-L-rhamnonate aldolase RhmA
MKGDIARWISATTIMYACFSMPSLRQRLLTGHKSYGPLLLSDSPLVAEMMATMGYGHIVVDHEHAATDIRSGQAMLQAIQAAHSLTMIAPNTSKNQPFRTEPIVRLPSANDPAYMKKVLDTLRLPGGVLVPMVNDAATAAAVVQSTRYPKQFQNTAYNEISSNMEGGIRGCAAPLVRASGWSFNSEYVQDTEQDLLVMIQVETLEGVKAIPEIAAVPGVDGIFLGPFDLSCSVGKMGQFDDPDVKDLIRCAEEAVVSSKDCFLAGFRAPGRDLHDMFHTAGYSLVCGSVDMALLRQAALADVETANDSLSRGT